MRSGEGEGKSAKQQARNLYIDVEKIVSLHLNVVVFTAFRHLYLLELYFLFLLCRWWLATVLDWTSPTTKEGCPSHEQRALCLKNLG
jgi:hypothetical protein